jgi:hypothetical protein
VEQAFSGLSLMLYHPHYGECGSVVRSHQ